MCGYAVRNYFCSLVSVKLISWLSLDDASARHCSKSPSGSNLKKRAPIRQQSYNVLFVACEYLLSTCQTLPSLISLDSAFQLQDNISLLIQLDVHDVNSIVSLPAVKRKGRKLRKMWKKRKRALYQWRWTTHFCWVWTARRLNQY